MKPLFLLTGLLASCSALKAPSAAQLSLASVSHPMATRPVGIYDAPSVTRSRSIPLVFVDERTRSFSTIKRLDPSRIDSIRIIKPAVGTAIYGHKARYGVILITTKKSRSK